MNKNSSSYRVCLNVIIQRSSITSDSLTEWNHPIEIFWRSFLQALRVTVHLAHEIQTALRIIHDQLIDTNSDRKCWHTDVEIVYRSYLKPEVHCPEKRKMKSNYFCIVIRFLWEGEKTHSRHKILAQHNYMLSTFCFLPIEYQGSSSAWMSNIASCLQCWVLRFL